MVLGIRVSCCHNLGPESYHSIKSEMKSHERFFLNCGFFIRECWLPRRLEWRKEKNTRSSFNLPFPLMVQKHCQQNFQQSTLRIKQKNTPEVSFTICEVWFTQQQCLIKRKWFCTYPLRSIRRENQNEFNLYSRLLLFMSWSIIIYHKHLISASACIHLQAVKLERYIWLVI